MFESGFKFYFSQWKKKQWKKSLLLSLMIIILKKKKSHKVPVLWGMSLSLSHFLWCVNLSLNFTLPTSTLQMQKCHMKKKNKHLGAIFFFFSIDINILYIILHMRLNYILLPVLCYVKWQLFQSCVLL